jgi:hypothetical protein
MISKIQIKLIKIGQKQIGLSDEQYRDMLSDRYWKHSCTELTYKEASDLIDHFKTLGFAVTPPSPSYVKRGQAKRGGVTRYESSIAGLRQEIADIARERFGRDFESPLNALCKKFKVDHWKFLNVATGKEIKAALIRMQQSGQPKNSLPPRPAATPPKIGGELMTKQQLKEIELLKADVLWSSGPMGYYKWLKAYLKKDSISTYKEAEAVKKALKGMRNAECGMRNAETGENYFRRDGGLYGGHYEW